MPKSFFGTPAPDPAMRHADLVRQRDQYPPDHPMQASLGPKEHGAYAELRVRDNPILGPVEQLGAIPGYTAAKLLGLMVGRSPPSIDEMAEAYRGLGRGVYANIQDLLK